MIRHVDASLAVESAPSADRSSADSAWLLTLAMAVAAALLAWSLGKRQQSLTVILATLLAASTLGVIVGVVADAGDRSNRRWQLSRLIDPCRALLLGWVWHQLGGVANPLFLVVFLAPLVTASLLSSWIDLTILALTIGLSVSAVTLFESSELQWYLIQLNLPGTPGLSFLPLTAARAPQLFEGATSTPQMQLNNLALFWLADLVVVLAGIISGAHLREWTARALATRSPDRHGPPLWDMLRKDPRMVALVYADTGQLLEVSQTFLNQMLRRRLDLSQGLTLFEAMNFAQPRMVAQALHLTSSELKVQYHVGSEARNATLTSSSVLDGDTRYSWVHVEDAGPRSWLARSVDASPDGLVLLDAQNDVVYHNEAARAWAPNIACGVSFGRVLPGWEEGLVTLLDRRENGGVSLPAASIRTATLQVGDRLLRELRFERPPEGRTEYRAAS